MKKLVFILFVLIASLKLNAQGEANFWYFGQNAGLDFNTTPPTAINGSLNTNEGCASFSDKEGNLLFYTDGITVWDKNNSPMPNGNNLLGDPSSTQSGIIVPHPGNSYLYYIFTVGADDYDNNGNLIKPTEGLNCYTVDMTNNGGLGDIVGPPIDLSIGRNASWTEKVTSVKGDDCNSFWVISLVNNTFVSYKVDENGIDPTPVISTINLFSDDKRGYLKVSPDGKKLACAIYGMGELLLYSFDDVTGKVANDGIRLITRPDDDGYAYGVEFSPSSTKLYCSTYNQINNRLFQFDLNSSNIADSKTLIKTQQGYRGALQLAPNGKIYATVPPEYFFGTRYLNAINAPDEVGLNCDYQLNAINLGTGTAMQGLPPFIASILLPIEITDGVSVQNINNTTLNKCVGQNLQLSAENIPGSPSYKWILNDSIISTSEILDFPNLIMSDSGTYYVEVETTDKCGFPTIYKGNVTLNVNENPEIASNIIYEQCDFDSNPIDGITTFNLTTRESELTNNSSNVEILFYETTDTNLESPVNKEAYRNINGPNHTLTVEVKNTYSECTTLGSIELNVLPTSLETYPDVYTCEIDLNENNSSATKSEGSGLGTFDFDAITNSIKSIFLTPVKVELYNNSYDALVQNSPISGIKDYEEQEIFVRIENEATQSCIGGGTFNLVINELPQPNGSEIEQILCVNNLADISQENSVQLIASTLNNSSDTYQWYFNNSLLQGETNVVLYALEEGTYRVEMTRLFENNLDDLSDNSLCTGYSTFYVKESNPAFINYDLITIVDDSDNNTISIQTSSLGKGDYEFALDDIYNEFQEEPYFENVSAGIHTLYIRDKNGCGTSQIEISILGFPKFFTPNNDGINDTWNILGINENIYTSSNVYIFDRFGKLIAQINPSEGWDGTFNGEHLSSSDYWFSVELIDDNGNKRIKKGHFSLIRK